MRYILFYCMFLLSMPAFIHTNQEHNSVSVDQIDRSPTVELDTIRTQLTYITELVENLTELSQVKFALIKILIENICP